MMYIAEIDLKKKKRQLIPLTRICLFGYVDGKRKNLEKNCTFDHSSFSFYQNLISEGKEVHLPDQNRRR